jgi:hypothetical protein
MFTQLPSILDLRRSHGLVGRQAASESDSQRSCAGTTSHQTEPSSASVVPAFDTLMPAPVGDRDDDALHRASHSQGWAPGRRARLTGYCCGCASARCGWCAPAPWRLCADPGASPVSVKTQLPGQQCVIPTAAAEHQQLDAPGRPSACMRFDCAGGYRHLWLPPSVALATVVQGVGCQR